MGLCELAQRYNAQIENPMVEYLAVQRKIFLSCKHFIGLEFVGCSFYFIQRVDMTLVCNSISICSIISVAAHFVTV